MAENGEVLWKLIASALISSHNQPTYCITVQNSSQTCYFFMLLVLFHKVLLPESPYLLVRPSVFFWSPSAKWPEEAPSGNQGPAKSKYEIKKINAPEEACWSWHLVAAGVQAARQLGKMGTLTWDQSSNWAKLPFECSFGSVDSHACTLFWLPSKAVAA